MEHRPSRARFVRSLGLASAVALVVGNMVGTSVYTLPASLAARAGPLGVVAWAITALGYLFVALVFASLAPRFPRTCGPYAYAREAFGERAGYLVTWSYWASTTVGNAAIAIGAVAYVRGLLGVDAGPALSFALAQAALWGACALNVLGVKQSARVQVVVMFLNVVPLLALSFALFAWFDPANLEPFAPHGAGALVPACAYIVWAYCGIESVTIPAEEVRSPERTLARATMLGYAIGTLVFLSTALAVAGALPNDVLASESARPIAAAAEATLGPWAASAISITAVAAALGTLNGWTLLMGRIPVSAAEDGAFFPALARVHPTRGTPHAALLVGTAIGSVCLFALWSATLLEAFDAIVELSLLLTLFVYASAAAAELVLARRARSAPLPVRSRVVAVLALGFLAFGAWGLGPAVSGSWRGWIGCAVVLAIGVALRPAARARAA